MSLSPVNEDNFEHFTIETHPSRSYFSRPRRSASGAKIYFTGSQGRLEEILDNTGSVSVFANTSDREKEVAPLATSTYTGFNDDSLEGLRFEIAKDTNTNINGRIDTYMTLVNASTQSLRTAAKQEIIRFTPTVNFTSNTLRKTIVTNNLMKFYRPALPNMNFNITNYNSLHFFHDAPNSTEFEIPSASAILYPNPRGTQITSGVFNSDYGIKEKQPFSFDFWIKPRYPSSSGEEYRAGTVLHLSGAYAISIHSGSVKDHNGKPTKFKLMLQLGSGSYIPPSKAVADPTGGVYVSSDNVLNLNTWHHVTIRYAGDNVNHGSGSFFVDTVKQGDFSFTSPGFGLWDDTGPTTLAPAVLCVGNFFNGAGISEDFFNANAALRDGLVQLSSGTSDPADSGFDFSHPLSGEVHDIKMYDKYLTTTEIEYLQTNAPANKNNLQFYLPPFFTEESPYRQFVGEYGGVLQTPFFEKDGTTNKPFNANLAFGANGHYINMENYVRDFVTGRYPRLWSLTGSSIESENSVVMEANSFLYSSGTHAGGVKKRLYSIMPCDHGDWNPNYNFLSDLSGSGISGSYKNDLGNHVPGMITLRDIVTGSFIPYTTQTSGTIVTDIFGDVLDETFVGGDLTADDDHLTIYNRVKDGDSNQVVVFDVSNLFYGKQILPGSLTLRDSSISGSDGKFGVTLKDDGIGNLYRADSLGKHATWASVGNVFYDEGIILIKSPQLYFFGTEGFDVDFKGLNNIHVMTINCYARSMQLVSSSNPSYDPTILADEELANSSDQRFVYITGINIHDENLNVIGRSHLAQPILKRTGEKMLFKWKLDF